MSQIAANPYINFQGQAREALTFYHQALGGNLILLAMSSDGTLREAKEGESIMHGALMSDGLLIMGSDGNPEYPASKGDNVAIALSGDDFDRLSLAFEALSLGGAIRQPLQKESWGDAHGKLTDAFGISWMVNITKNNSTE
jgi:PhnB protein